MIIIFLSFLIHCEYNNDQIFVCVCVYVECKQKLKHAMRLIVTTVELSRQKFLNIITFNYEHAMSIVNMKMIFFILFKLIVIKH